MLPANVGWIPSDGEIFNSKVTDSSLYVGYYVCIMGKWTWHEAGRFKYRTFLIALFYTKPIFVDMTMTSTIFFIVLPIIAVSVYHLYLFRIGIRSHNGKWPTQPVSFLPKQSLVQ